MNKDNHTYNIQLVNRVSLVSVGMFSDYYRYYLSIIDNSKFELKCNRFTAVKKEIDKILETLREFDLKEDNSTDRLNYSKWEEEIINTNKT